MPSLSPTSLASSAPQGFLSHTCYRILQKAWARAELQSTEELAGKDMEFVVFEDPNLKEGKGFLSEESWPESQ